MKRLLFLLAVCTSCAEDPSQTARDSAPPPVGDLELWVDPMFSGESTTLTATGAGPGREVWFALSTAGIGVGPCRDGLCTDLRSPRLLGRVTADSSGTAELTVNVPPTASGEVALQALSWGPDGVSPPVGIDVVAPGADRAALLDGVESLVMGSALPAAVAVFEDHAFPLAAAGPGRAVAAAARVSGGKVFVGGHEGPFLTSAMSGLGDEAQLLRNALDWMGPTNPSIGLDASLASMEPWLTSQGYTAVVAPISELSAHDIYISAGSTPRTDAESEAIRDWIRYGGGFIAAGQAWWWSNSHDAYATDDYPVNAGLREAGLAITEDPVFSPGTFTISPAPLSDAYHGSRAITLAEDALGGAQGVSQDDLSMASEAIGWTISMVGLDHPYIDRVSELSTLYGPVAPTESQPLDLTTDPVAMVAARLQHKRAVEASPADVVAHPAHAAFPGTVAPSATTSPIQLTIDGDFAGRDARYGYANARSTRWFSTGRYAPAGAVITVTVPSSIAGQGVGVQIGTHTDRLWDLDTWKRFPEIVRRDPLAAATTLSASAFGGPIYITVPPDSSLGDFDVTIEGGVPMPYFVLGETTQADWQSQLTTQAPWAELQGQDFTITVPSTDAATVSQPQTLMAFWDEVLAAQAQLAALPLPRPRTERATVDAQISVGWMHSGHPFMATMASVEDLVDLSMLTSSGSWGVFHELGHNHQWLPAVLPGTTEATVNLFTLYAMETVVGLAPGTGHPALEPATRQQRLQDYLQGGADFWSAWEVWTALETYLQLQEAFGWSLFETVHATYRLDDPSDDPTTDRERIDLWAVRSAEAAGVDLGPFYLAWGWPLGDAAVQTMQQLPPWTQDPMNP